MPPLIDITGLGAVTCTGDSIQLDQARTGAVVGGAPEYEVTITNTCSCPQSNVVISCGTFASRESVDPNLFKRIDEENCLANNGRPILHSSPLKFRYAWPTAFILFPTTPGGTYKLLDVEGGTPASWQQLVLTSA
ncbi:hypothetical protein ACLOJK_025509 [Asimina triloba]